MGSICQAAYNDHRHIHLLVPLALSELILLSFLLGAWKSIVSPDKLRLIGLKARSHKQRSLPNQGVTQTKGAAQSRDSMPTTDLL